jgi:hypothetical protein
MDQSIAHRTCPREREVFGQRPRSLWGERPRSTSARRDHLAREVLRGPRHRLRGVDAASRPTTSARAVTRSPSSRSLTTSISALRKRRASVVDDVVSVQPWKVRGIEIRGAIEIVPMGGSALGHRWHDDAAERAVGRLNEGRWRGGRRGALPCQGGGGASGTAEIPVFLASRSLGRTPDNPREPHQVGQPLGQHFDLARARRLLGAAASRRSPQCSSAASRAA